MITILLGQGNRNNRELNPSVSQKGTTTSNRDQATHIAEQRKRLRISRVIRNEEAKIGIPKNSSDSGQPGSATRDNTHVLPSILARFALTMVLIVQIGDGLSQWLDAGSGTVFAASHADID